MRILYTMIRVKDLDRSLNFYTGAMGMTLFRKEEYPSGRFTLAFVGYGANETEGAVIELTWNWREQVYHPGNGWGHIAISCHDLVARCDSLRSQGINIDREPGPMRHLSPSRTAVEDIAFITDPDGYRIELIQA